MSARLDLLVVGSGIAGLTAAVRARAEGLAVAVLTKDDLAATTTSYAQGGIAAVLAQDGDSVDQHVADTLAAGAGLCDEAAVHLLVSEGPARVHELIERGARFDRDDSGALALAREGGHSRARVVHAGGTATGLELQRALAAATDTSGVTRYEHCLALDLIMEDGRAGGVLASAPGGGFRRIEARNILLGSGGCGQLFAVTTNPLGATGDGVSMALRAGAAVADLEFIQFHPTALAVDRVPRPLLSEALRGHGALLRDGAGERFVDELAPRDVVSRAIMSQLLGEHRDHVWLDATGLADFDARFPNLAAVLASVGLRADRDWIPVAPAAHYLCGGVMTDLWGATSVAGLWAAGEVACTGVHGANRLASNSLLEGLVFGDRVIEAIIGGGDLPPSGVLRGFAGQPGGVAIERLDLDVRFGAQGNDGSAAVRSRLQRVMTTLGGVVRSRESLQLLNDSLLTLTAAGVRGRGREAAETRSLLTLGMALTAAASRREETRGAHTRSDHPNVDPAQVHRTVICMP